MINTYTSTGAKFFHHQEVMTKLRNGWGQPIVAHIMPTDVCNHTCAFCSVQHRAGDTLALRQIEGFLDQLVPIGLKAVILSGGGNPLLYHCKETGNNFNGLVDVIHSRGLDIGLITNGIPLRRYEDPGRIWWKTVNPLTLDKLTWIRISMAGLDHAEHCVYVPDIDPAKTTLGFSYVAHDIYDAPEDKAHGKVSTIDDVKTLGGDVRAGQVIDRKVRKFEDRFDELIEEFAHYCNFFKPRYLRLLPNCLEPQLIPQRCRQLQRIADEVNYFTKREVAFVQYKPPAAPKACYLGYIHPVLNADGYVYPCDSCVLNDAAGHQFANPWRVCRWDEIGDLYRRPVRSLIVDPARTCPGCVFHQSNTLLGSVVNGTADLTPPTGELTHINFV